MNENNFDRPRYKSISFWIGIVSVAILATGVKPESLTSWHAVWNMITTTADSPAKIVLVGTSILAAWNNPSRKGLN